MIETLINPEDDAERRTAKLLIIAEALMRRVEQATDDSGAAYAQFQRAALLEDQVRERTRELGHALDLLNESNGRLAQAMRAAETARQDLADAIETIQEGFALFDRDERLVMFNSRFAIHLPDVRNHLSPGLAFVDYVDLVSRSAFLALPEGEAARDWAQRRLRGHQDRHVIQNVRLIGEQWLQVSEHRTAEGGTVILQTDVTDIIRAERHERGKLLDDQARVIKATLDHIDQGVVIFDADLKLVGWNHRLVVLFDFPAIRLQLGVSVGNLLGRLRAEMQIGGDMTMDRLFAWVYAGRGRPPLRFEARQGAARILDVFAQEMPGGGFVMSFTDVTAERAALVALSRANETLEARVVERTLELEDALERAERANAGRSRFVAAASHDLLQPLSAAKLFISSITWEALDATGRLALDKAQNALRSVEGILDALLDISKLESGKAAVCVGSVPLNRLLSQLCEEFTPLAAAKGLELKVLPCGAWVESDPTYLRRILQNLIGNAIRYTAQGRVTVGVRRRGGAVRIEVWDTGPGIPEEAQDSIFREFHRLNASASASEGMGLGLAIVERACGLLGHPLELRSVVGHGSCFMVQVPLSLASEDEPDPVEAPGRADPRTSGADKIAFLVENDADMRRALGLLLEKWGMTVLDAPSGEEALALIEEIGILPDLFLVDQQLGDGATGLEFIGEIFARYGPVPARIITANRGDDVRAAAEAAGIEMLYKPIDPGVLQAAIARL